MRKSVVVKSQKRKRENSEGHELMWKLAEAMREMREARKEVVELLRELEKEPTERIR